MKDISEMTEEEFALVDNEEIDRRIKIKCMEEGIIIPVKPVPPEKPKPKNPVTIHSYSEFKSLDREVVESIKTLIDKLSSEDKLITTAYRYGVSWDYNYLEDVDSNREYQKDIQINSKEIYSKEEYNLCMAGLARYSELTKKYDEDKKEYDKQLEAYNYIRKEFYDKYYEIGERFNYIISLRDRFKEYLNLSDNNLELAKKFFLQAYAIKHYVDFELDVVAKVSL